MNSSAASLMLWNWRRWVVCVLGLLVAQLALIWWLSDYKVIAPPAQPARTHVRLLPKLGPPGQLTGDQADPTLFALVTPHGFSRSAWLTVGPFNYQMTNRPEPLQWLNLPSDDLADDFAEFVQTNLLSEELVLERLPPTLAQPALASPVVEPETRLKIEGPLQQRALITRQALPQHSATLLTNTVVQSFVDPAGMTVSVALLASCGVTKADQDAMSFARAARFSRWKGLAGGAQTNESGHVFGTLVFQWSRVRWGETSTTTAQR